MAHYTLCPNNPCKKDSSRVGASSRLVHNATNTTQQG